jgi:molecular chaperone IbpA
MDVRTITMSPMSGYRLAPNEGALNLMDRAMGGSAPGVNWPPYNVVSVADDRYRIILAVPGFRDGDLEIVSEPNRLTVSGRPQEVQQDGEVVYRGIAQQPFRRMFELADHVHVQDARLENGLLTIELVREIPEALKPRRIQITGGGASANGQAGSAESQDQKTH